MHPLNAAEIRPFRIPVRPLAKHWNEHPQIDIFQDQSQRGDRQAKQQRRFCACARGNGERHAENTAGHDVGRDRGANGERADKRQLQRRAHNDAGLYIPQHQPGQQPGDDRP